MEPDSIFVNVRLTNAAGGGSYFLYTLIIPMPTRVPGSDAEEGIVTIFDSIEVPKSRQCEPLKFRVHFEPFV